MVISWPTRYPNGDFVAGWTSVWTPANLTPTATVFGSGASYYYGYRRRGRR